MRKWETSGLKNSKDEVDRQPVSSSLQIQPDIGKEDHQFEDIQISSIEVQKIVQVLREVHRKELEEDMLKEYVVSTLPPKKFIFSDAQQENYLNDGIKEALENGKVRCFSKSIEHDV